MATLCLSAPALSSTSKPLAIPSTSATYSSSSSSFSSTGCFCRPNCCSCSMISMPMFASRRVLSGNWRRAKNQVVCMAPDEEKLTRRNPLDFPIEWERPKPGRRPDIFPQFSPMKTPLPPPLPYDPPEEDEEEEEKKEEEEEEDPETEDPDNPEKQ
ncbi:tRNA 2-thiocytidine biosynthesis TtcA [Quillaja saponaria]|uniref:tRNA 2-thiocytidine biosynthesis TtcA n=1 Tax=Quillaja saponaria TaxID=32244 RepID=A0AAD7M440_QUISA|nr:tRNA 2-thiocytidine biosynthesis TtcA [Quillaja saponaria]